MKSGAETLASWAHAFTPSDADLELADRCLLDTLAVTLGGRTSAICEVSRSLPEAARWAAVGHVLDYDDLHIESTTHVSVVCVAATLAVGGDPRAFLVGAGAMSRLGTALGWPHYSRGWHATCTAGAPAAAAAAAYALGLTESQTADAITLAVQAAGGVQGAFGSMAKALQVGLATTAGVQAAKLVAASATVNRRAFDEWLQLMGGRPELLDDDVDSPAVQGGLAIKIFPCCYALQRPISAMAALSEHRIDPASVTRIKVVTPESCVQPLIHHDPKTGLEGKFSMEYALAATLLDGRPGPQSFLDSAVTRDAAKRLVDCVQIVTTAGGDNLLSGDIDITVDCADGSSYHVSLDTPPGAPDRPPGDAEMTAKMRDCGEDVPELLRDVDWANASELLLEHIPG
ncbi:MAG TPA: MmgE/PrpD family protein [Jatrophihabitans sp.]|jgi:2-methylcitrate dehydratase PrpD